MYEAYYGLSARPFSILPDPRFLFWSAPHSMAFAMLEYGVLSHAGFTVITGEVGSGKTTLIRHLISKLPGDINVGLVTNTQGDRGDLLQWLMMALGQEFEGHSYAALFQRFEQFLKQQNARGRRTVLIIDEAQNLGARSLEELRMTTNLNESDQELLQIILVGQPELKALLSRPELVQFAQRVSSDFHLNVLSREESQQYIAHRLIVAGSARNLFTTEATELIHHASQGVPRLINILCDTALMYGFAKNATMVSVGLVQAVLHDKRKHGVFPLGEQRLSDPVDQSS
jgi:type II secretory pathway predicted ATPase ExeA